MFWTKKQGLVVEFKDGTSLTFTEGERACWVTASGDVPITLRISWGEVDITVASFLATEVVGWWKC